MGRCRGVVDMAEEPRSLAGPVWGEGAKWGYARASNTTCSSSKDMQPLTSCSGGWLPSVKGALALAGAGGAGGNACRGITDE
jgi:hypothetical protein